MPFENFSPPDTLVRTSQGPLQLLEGYQIDEFIDQGGMAKVFKGRQLSLNRCVAIKILHEKYSTSPYFRSWFEAEARAMAILNHPNLVSIHDFGESHKLLYMVMEFVPDSLFGRLYNTTFKPDDALDIISKVCRGLAHCHQEGVIHRDIKPSNILIDKWGQPKIADFGLAYFSEDKIASGNVSGTEGYSAPEFYNNQPFDHRVDIFSAGAVLYQLISGQQPHLGRTSLTTENHSRIDSIISKATEKDPTARFATAGEFADEVDKLIKELKSTSSAEPAKKVVYDQPLSPPQIQAPPPPKGKPAGLVISNFSS